MTQLVAQRKCCQPFAMSANRLALRAYRALLTQARAVGARGSDTLTVRLPVEGSWGHGQTFHGSEKYRRAVQRYLGDLAQTSQVAFLSADIEPVRVLILQCDPAHGHHRCLATASRCKALPCAPWKNEHQDLSRQCTGELLRYSISTPSYVNALFVLQTAASRCSITLDSLADTIRTRFRAAKNSSSQEAAGQI